MRKITVRIMAAAGICLFLGVGFSLAGWRFGGQPGFYLDSKGLHTSRELEQMGTDGGEALLYDSMGKTELDGLHSIDIESIFDTITIKPSSDDHCYLQYQVYKQEDLPVYTMENGVLSMNLSGRPDTKNSWRIDFFLSIYGDNEKPAGVTLYLPKTLSIASLKLRTINGSIAINDVAANALTIANDNGSVTLKGVTADNMEVTMKGGDLAGKNLVINSGTVINSDGDTALKLLGTENEYNYDLKSGKGAIAINGHGFDQGDVVKNNGAYRTITVKTEKGDVAILTN